MATKPTASDASWGTDASFSSGPESGNPVKVNPSVGVKAQGWRPGDALGFVGAWFNFWMNQVYLWILYLSDLHNSADFLNKAYAWVEAHTWVVANGTQAVSVTQSTGGAHAIVASASGGGDALQASSGHVRVASGNVIVEAGTVSATGNISSGGEYVYPTGKSRTKLVPLRVGTNPGGWFPGQDGSMNTPTTNGLINISVDLPDGAIVTQMRVLAYLDATPVTNGLRVRLLSYRKDATNPEGANTQNGGGPLAELEFLAASPSASDRSLGTDSTVTAHGHDVEQDYCTLQVTSADTITATQAVDWVELTYNIAKPPDR